MSQVTLKLARKILGDDVFDPSRLSPFLGKGSPLDTGASLPLPLAELEAAAGRGCVLIWRTDRFHDDQPITLGTLYSRFAEVCGDDQRGFRAGNAWYLKEPFAEAERPEVGWALVAATPSPASCNQTYDAGWAMLPGQLTSAGWRRRTAIEIAYDCLAAAASGGTRALASAWDWSSTESQDEGLVNIGGFTPAGLEILAYSRAVKHGGLGICPTRVFR